MVLYELHWTISLTFKFAAVWIIKKAVCLLIEDGTFHCYEDEGYILAGGYFITDGILGTSLTYNCTAVSILEYAACL